MEWQLALQQAYLLHCDKPLQMKDTVWVQCGLGAYPPTKHHQQTGEHTQQPDVYQQVEEHQPYQHHTEAQQASLSQNLSHGWQDWLIHEKM